MNLSILDFESNIPPSVRTAAMRIAVRTMMKTEALDFDLDPRGIIPKNIHLKIINHVERQLQFVIGHEYSHHIHGHLDSGNTIKQSVFRALANDGESAEPPHRFYNHLEKEEFQADESSLLIPVSPKDELKANCMAAIVWFSYLDIYEQAQEQLFFSKSSTVRTHPKPIERLQNIFNKIGASAGVDEQFAKDFAQTSAQMRKQLQEDIAVNTDLYEFYGSVYLAEPNTDWRGKKLIDRVDYY